ncbi:hypothetical protein Tsubulata_017502 [Turnera subulata]|uniref:Ninja-family protein n=1 Tax=Turnera subulata TaxID=218843 RepID=A0A9Q0J839_9ROSI|nr:hypothetical protein Tsubulata_017502 [Turnera subulata]
MHSNTHQKGLWEKFSSQENPTGTKLFIQETQYEQPDLNLGLSLGGIYSENSRERLLNRSSSQNDLLTLNRTATVELDPQPPKSFLSLARSSSLPTEAEKEQRRMVLRELVRRRFEAAQTIAEQMGAFGVIEKENSPPPEPMPSSPSKVAAWAAASASKSPAFRRAILRIQAHTALHGNGNFEGLGDLAAEKDVGSSQTLANFRGVVPKVNCWGTGTGGTVVKPAESILESPNKKAKVSGGWSGNNAMDSMKHMPTVATTGGIPNGRRIEGILYKCTNAQICIVCVCHGNFLSPEEFVRHAGGKDVTNPMRNITICTAPFSF